MIDILKIKNAKYLKFYVEESIYHQKYIYCENTKTGERVVVGEYETNVEAIVEYLKHHTPIVIKDGKGWCNANINLKNGTLEVQPDYNMPFDD